MNYLLTIASPYDPSMTHTGLIWGELTLDKIEKMVNTISWANTIKPKMLSST